MSAAEYDSRRNAAAQYYLSEEQDDSTEQKIVNLLNEAAISSDAKIKSENLHKVKEIIINLSPYLLDNFLEEILGFQHDKNPEVKKAVVAFIEEASKKEADVLPRIVGNLIILLQDSSIQVQKRALQASSHVYKAVLMWISKQRNITSSVERTWVTINQVKSLITQMIDNDNDGIRTHAVKFLETVVLLQTYPEPESMKRENDFSLEDVPMTLKIAKRRSLEEEALLTLDLMIKFHGSAHISSINLMTCMGSLTLIARMRPKYMNKIVNAMESLNKNLPPTLSTSQVSSVRKHMKVQLLTILKHPASYEMQSNITSLLSELGASSQEIARNQPKPEEVKKRQKRLEALAQSQPAAKRARFEVPEQTEAIPAMDDPASNLETEVDRLEQFIYDRLGTEVVTTLVTQSLTRLPDKMPASFLSSYKPVSSAGTTEQIRAVSRLMATQFNVVGFGPDCTRAFNTQSAVFNQRLLEDYDEDDEIEIVPKKQPLVVPEPPKVSTPPPAPVVSTVSLPRKIPKIKTLKLNEITKPLNMNARSTLIRSAVNRILKAEGSANGSLLPVRNKILTVLASQFTRDVRETVFDYILEDVKSRSELAFQWLYEEYSYFQGFNRSNVVLRQDSSHERAQRNYNKLLCGLINSLFNQLETNKERDTLLWRLYLESPLITEEAIDMLKHQCSDESKAANCLGLLQQLIIRRPPRQLIFLNSLLIFSSHDNANIRSRALSAITDLYKRGDLKTVIEEYAVLYLGFLRFPNPPEVLFNEFSGRNMIEKTWTDNTIRCTLCLYLLLLPLNESLIHELARVYLQTDPDVKRTILRLVEQPVRGMGMESPQLLKLVEDCPKGAETLVTRVIHILTEKAAPSAELVSRVRELYQSRVYDVRFLIPVLNGLTKDEVIAALPKLIKLNPVVVKEVFNRLLGTHVENESFSSPITPAELLIALHNIDPTKADMKTIMKATSLCFGEQQVYTQEVLAIVMQNLMEQNPLPTLFMRTVLQSLALYPHLTFFILNILQRLISKQVWKQRKVWEGFVKCCQRTKPHSFQVMLQLPPPQLEDLFNIGPDLQRPLLDHVMSFTETQKSHIPLGVMDVLQGKTKVVVKKQPNPPGED